MTKLEFPDGFLWGASTASHQVEGNTLNQWSEWERSPGRLAALEKEGLVAKYGKDNFISGNAADHYRRFEEDFTLAKELGHNATRVSLEWSRIEPREGEFDADAIEHYRRVIASIRKNGMEPFVTLWHWTFPLWFRDKGGFEKRKNIHYFTRYAERMTRDIPDVRFWITLNEPEIVTSNSYLRGLWPPQQKSFPKALRVLNTLIAAHREAYAAMKRVDAKIMVGIAKNNIFYDAKGGSILDAALAKVMHWSVNRYFLDRIRDRQDFIGLNHYFHNRIRSLKLNQNENRRANDMGWELYPEAIHPVLTDLKSYRVPIYITENGLADERDSQREWFIKETLKNVHRAIRDGADVRGYLHWSLMDNFEWAHGFWPRFGLIAIDYATEARAPRSSAYAYKKICEENGLEE